MSSELSIILSVLLGMLGGGAHLLLLKRTLDRSYALRASQARRRVLRGLPFRLLVWVPLMLFAVQRGWGACLALAGGLTLSRVWLPLWMRAFLRTE